MPEQTTEIDLCICPPEGPCLGAESDSGSTVECAACLVLDPELPCLHETEECDHCEGTGDRYGRTTGTIDCPECGGTGQINRSAQEGTRG